MKKIVLISIILIALLTTGCGVSSLGNFVLPDDIEFINTIKTLDTPQKVCEYIQNNFIPEAHLFYNLNPYELYKTKKGDCYDTAIFAQFVANFHGYTTYIIVITFKDTSLKHALVVYEEEKGYTFSSWGSYFDYETLQDNFRDIVNLYYNYNKWSKYTVYGYDTNTIEEGYNN